MSLFDFDLGEYTQWIILLLAFLNLIFSCCGCFGTYKFSELDKESKSKLDSVTEELKSLVDGITADNKALAETLRKFEVEITHIQGENKELRQSLDNFKRQEDDILEVRRGNARVNVRMRELWNLLKTVETNDMICRVTRITAEYYKKAYEDGDTEPGLNEEQYESLIRSSVIPQRDKAYFPSFVNSVWDKNGRFGKTEDGPILVDELERVCVLIYKRVLQRELEVELDKDAVDTAGRPKDIALTRQILDPQEEKKEDGGFFANIVANVFGGD